VLLSVIPRAPAYYNPFTNPHRCLDAAVTLVNNHNLRLSEEALSQTLSSVSSMDWNNKAPHFIQLSKRQEETKERSKEAVGKQEHLEEQSYRGTASSASGSQSELQTITTRPIQPTEKVTSIDLEVTGFLQDRIAYYLEKYKEHRLRHGSGILVDNHTGEIIAYVGSKNYYSDEEASQLDGVRITRQPGSCLKPFLYAYALENGYLPNTVLPDIPVDYGREEVYEPLNFNNRFHGPVRLRVALASSLNVPAVSVLKDLGVSGFESFLIELGFDSLRTQIGETGLGLALGNGEISLYELVRAFAVFPRRGVPLTYRYTKTDGTTSVFCSTTPNRSLVSRYTADSICDILSDHHSRFLGFDDSQVFDLGFPVMFKTGTSDQFQNIWAVAATPDYSVGIWMGNATGETVQGVTGSSLPATIAGEVLTFVQRQNSVTAVGSERTVRCNKGITAVGSERAARSRDFPTPYGSKKVEVCTLSGKKPTDACPSAVYENIPEAEHIGTCDYHVREGNSTTVVLPQLYAQWLARSGNRRERTDGTVRRSGNRSGVSGNTTAQAINRRKIAMDPVVRPKKLSIIYPGDGAIFYEDPSIPRDDQAVAVKAVGSSDVVKVFINGRHVDTITPPLRWFFPIKPGVWNVTFEGSGSADSVGFTVK
jgi:penicillin-binding protein 1C